MFHGRDTNSMAVKVNLANPAAGRSGPPPERPTARRSLLRKIVTALVVTYAVAIVVLWQGMYWEGDRSWLATLFLFGPRWICALPLALLVPAVAIWNRRMWWLLAVTGVLIVGPVLGFQFHLADASGQVALRILTCNVNQARFDPEILAEILDRDRPDIVALQEVPGRPPPIPWPPGWHVVRRDEYLVASRFPIVRHEGLPCPGVPGKLAAIRYTVELPHRDVQLFNLHLFSPRWGLEAVLDRNKGLDVSKAPSLEASLRQRANETRAVSDWIAQFPGAKIVVGDFNTPVESAIYRQYWSWLENAFSTAGFGFGFTKITETGGMSYGARIDHVLYTPPWRCVRAWVGPDIGSDHLPLVVEFN
jgi:vancomycin resistance protein VanJ